MDDTLQELENELKSLAPRRPSSGLQIRLERDLDPGVAIVAPGRARIATTFRSWMWVGWPLAAAVALTTVLGVWRWQAGAPAVIPATTLPAAAAAQPDLASHRVAPAATSRDVYLPVAATNVLYDLRDEGPVSPEDNTSGRRMRYRYVDTYTWRNAATHASLKWSIPREEVRVIPASFH
ncbi:MAG: hypothetical protein ACHQ5A_06695 [Opitutales bacterium]